MAVAASCLFRVKMVIMHFFNDRNIFFYRDVSDRTLNYCAFKMQGIWQVLEINITNSKQTKYLKYNNQHFDTYYV